MSLAARSIFVFAVYLWVVGAVLVLASPMLLLFGVVDALAATWTAVALRAGNA